MLRAWHSIATSFDCNAVSRTTRAAPATAALAAPSSSFIPIPIQLERIGEDLALPALCELVTLAVHRTEYDGVHGTAQISMRLTVTNTTLETPTPFPPGCTGHTLWYELTRDIAHGTTRTDASVGVPIGMCDVPNLFPLDLYFCAFWRALPRALTSILQGHAPHAPPQSRPADTAWIATNSRDS